MDPKSELAELKKNLRPIAAKSAEDITEDELHTLEMGTARITILKDVIERAERVTNLTKGSGQYDEYDADGNLVGTSEAKGFLTPASVKSTARTAAARGIKALVAEGSSATQVALDPNPIRKGMANLGILSLLPVTVRDTPKYSYLRQSTRTTNAAVVAPGDLKPTSVYTAASVDNELKVYAHISEMLDTYLLADNSNLADFLEAELNLGLLRKVTGDAVTALRTASGIQSIAFSGSAADSLYLGKSAIESLGYETSFIVVPRATFNGVRLDKDGDGNYKSSGVFEGGIQNGIWGSTTLISDDVPAGKALVIGAGAAGVSTDRQGVTTAWDTATGFDRNQVRARTEGRWAFDVWRPEAIALVSTVSA